MSQGEGLSTGLFYSDRGDLSYDSVPKVESPGGGDGPLSTELEPLGITCETARAPYLPARSLAWDLAGVERWVGRLAGDLGPWFSVSGAC